MKIEKFWRWIKPAAILWEEKMDNSDTTTTNITDDPGWNQAGGKFGQPRISVDGGYKSAKCPGCQ